MRRKLVCAAMAAMLAVVFPCSARAQSRAESGDEAMALARQLGDAVRRQDAAAAEKLLDTDALFDRCSAGINAPADFKARVKQSFQPQSHRLMDGIVKAAGAGAYHLLRVRQVNGETHVLFRLVGTSGGLNYHNWVAVKDRQGRLRFQDAYIATSGEMLSQTMHRAYLQAAIASNPGLLDRLSGKDKELAGNLAQLLKIAQDLQRGQAQQVLADYRALPAAMQTDKSCMLIRLQAAFRLRRQSPQEYNAAMVDYKRAFPGDPSVDLDCTDALVEAKQFAEARQSFDRLEAFTGGDPYLLVLRGNTYKLEGGDDNLARARQLYQKAVEEEPTLAPAYWAQVTLSLEARQYDQTAALLTQIQQKLHLKIKDLTHVPAYAGFVQSDAYKKWLASQTPASQTPDRAPANGAPATAR